MTKRRTETSPSEWLHGVYIDKAFPRLSLQDEQWSKIATLSEIPEANKDARRDIEITLGQFREFQADALEEMPPAEIRKELRTLANKVRNCAARLSRLMKDQNAKEAITGGRMSNRERLRQLVTVLDPEWFLRAADRVEAGKRGPKVHNVTWLVSNLGAKREQYAAKKITRSYKDDKSTR
jgi:hypothetical protein